MGQGGCPRRGSEKIILLSTVASLLNVRGDQVNAFRAFARVEIVSPVTIPPPSVGSVRSGDTVRHQLLHNYGRENLWTFAAAVSACVQSYDLRAKCLGAVAELVGCAPSGECKGIKVFSLLFSKKFKLPSFLGIFSTPQTASFCCTHLICMQQYPVVLLLLLATYRAGL